MCIMKIVLLVVTVAQIREALGKHIFCENNCLGSFTVMPQINDHCEYDAFISSTPFKDKVFLHPWKRPERTADWYEARGYCAKHCAELVTIHSKEENVHFLNFMRSIDLRDAVWLGAEIDNTMEFTVWSNGETATYWNKAAGEYNEGGHTCLSAGYVTNQNLWYNYYCTHPNYLVACQRPANWTICEDEAKMVLLD